MRKHLLFIVLSALLLSGCGSNKKETIDETEINTEMTEEEIEAQIKNDNRLSPAFKNYLLSQETAVIGTEANFEDFDFISPISSGQSATIQDMCNMIENDMDNKCLLGVSYGLIDCGMDGQFELAVEYEFLEPESNLTVAMTTIVCEDQGKLTLSFVAHSVYKIVSHFYADGCYVQSSHIAISFGSDYGILDSTGCLEMIFKEQYWDREQIDPDDLALLAYFGYDSMEQITKEDKQTINDLLHDVQLIAYTIGPETYLNCHPESDPNADKLSPSYYLSLCEKYGTVFYSDEEVNALIDQRKSDLGFTKWTGDHSHEDIEWNHLAGDKFGYIY